MKTRSTKTARELVEELQRDPEWVARRLERERARQEVERASAAEQAPLIQDLAKCGLPVESVWDLVNSRNNYDHALPVLMNHLTRPYSPGVREGIARAVAIPAAAPEWMRLASLYASEENSRVKDGLAVAIATSARAEHADALISLAQDHRNGQSRVLLLRAIARLGEKGRKALEMFEFDPELEKEARIVLRKLGRRLQVSRSGKAT